MVEDEGQDLSLGEMETKPGQVKRPMNAFMLWSKEKRRKISSVDPSLHNSRISKILGEEWKKLPMKEKDPYIRESKSLMDKHKKEHPDYHYKPRQNKLTKALKELSSLHSTLAAPPGFASKIRSLSAFSAFVNVPRTVHCDPYPIYQRPKAFQKYVRERSHPCCEIPDHNLFQASCSSCTCSLSCMDSNWMARQRYSPHHRYVIDEQCYRSSRPSFVDKTACNSSGWRHCSATSRYGWSVPTLVEEVNQRSKGDDDRAALRFMDTTEVRSEKGLSEEESAPKDNDLDQNSL